jgi:predicted  nucleic acid-binding Zn-ribbon protein
MLEKLSEVQSRDLELLALEEERKKTPPELIELRRRKESLEAALAQTLDKRREVQKTVNDNELELQSLEARRKSAADAAVAAASGKEASQYQNQELQFATRVQELEEDTMPLLERLEALDAESEALRAQLAELEPQLEQIASAEHARVSALDEKAAALLGERDALAREIDGSLLKQYEQVRRAKRGLGLVAVIDMQRCGGCNMRLPMHVVQKVATSASVTRCPSCGRILWVPEKTAS